MAMSINVGVNQGGALAGNWLSKHGLQELAIYSKL